MLNPDGRSNFSLDSLATLLGGRSGYVLAGSSSIAESRTRCVILVLQLAPHYHTQLEFCGCDDCQCCNDLESMVWSLWYTQALLAASVILSRYSSVPNPDSFITSLPLEEPSSRLVLCMPPFSRFGCARLGVMSTTSVTVSGAMQAAKWMRASISFGHVILERSS